MCVIVDANQSSLVFGSTVADDYKPVRKWIESGRGRLVYGGHKFKQELKAVTAAALTVQNWRQRGLAIEISEVALAAEVAVVVNLGTRSDDPHVIALVRVSGARTVLTKDGPLTTDLTNPTLVNTPQAKVYRTAEHTHLPRHTVSCNKTTALR